MAQQTLRKVYITDQSWTELRAAIKDKAQVPTESDRPDGALRVFIDDGAGTHLDILDIYKKSVEPAKH